LSVDESLTAIQEWNARCVPPWTEQDLRKKLTDAGQEPVTFRLRDAERQQIGSFHPAGPRPQNGAENPPYPLTDTGNAERLRDRHGENLRYCFVWGKWICWDDTRWKIDDTGEIWRKCKDTVRATYAEIAAIPEDAERKGAHAVWWIERHCRLY